MSRRCRRRERRAWTAAEQRALLDPERLDEVIESVDKRAHEIDLHLRLLAKIGVVDRLGALHGVAQISLSLRVQSRTSRLSLTFSLGSSIRCSPSCRPTVEPYPKRSSGEVVRPLLREVLVDELDGDGAGPVRDALDAATCTRSRTRVAWPRPTRRRDARRPTNVAEALRARTVVVAGRQRHLGSSGDGDRRHGADRGAVARRASPPDTRRSPNLPGALGHQWPPIVGLGMTAARRDPS